MGAIGKVFAGMALGGVAGAADGYSKVMDDQMKFKRDQLLEDSKLIREKSLAEFGSTLRKGEAVAAGEINRQNLDHSAGIQTTEAKRVREQNIIDTGEGGHLRENAKFASSLQLGNEKEMAAVNAKNQQAAIRLQASLAKDPSATALSGKLAAIKAGVAEGKYTPEEGKRMEAATITGSDIMGAKGGVMSPAVASLYKANLDAYKDTEDPKTKEMYTPAKAQALAWEATISMVGSTLSGGGAPGRNIDIAGLAKVYAAYPNKAEAVQILKDKGLSPEEIQQVTAGAPVTAPAKPVPVSKKPVAPPHIGSAYIKAGFTPGDMPQDKLARGVGSFIDKAFSDTGRREPTRYK